MMASLKALIPGAWRSKFVNFILSLDKRAMSKAEFRDVLVAYGMTPGATVMVHSSFKEIGRRVTGITAVATVALMQELVGSEGTILMPSFPFIGNQFQFIDSNPVFNVRRTPSKVGLLTEVFRRSKGVVRSWHPTHSVAAWGKDAERYVDGHHVADAFGAGSVFDMLSKEQGVILGLGIRPRKNFTFWHGIEFAHAATRELLYADPVNMNIKSGDGVVECQVRPMRSEIKTAYGAFEEELLATKVLRMESHHGLVFSSARTDEMYQAGLEYLDKGTFYDEGYPLTR